LHGYYTLDAGVKGDINRSYYFEGAGSTTQLPYSFQGPRESDFNFKDTISIADQIWSPCNVNRNRVLNLANGLSGNKSQFPNARDLPNLYHISWRRCSYSRPQLSRSEVPRAGIQPTSKDCVKR
jgi:hypothetical protein